MSVQVRAARAADLPHWQRLRQALWPGDEDSIAELALVLQEPDHCCLLAFVDGQPAGFAELSLRHDYVNGTDSSPVGFLEGWYVTPGHRRQGLGAQLVRAARAWARSQGCSELASDARLEDAAAQAAHRACGFAETERVVYFRIGLD